MALGESLKRSCRVSKSFRMNERPHGQAYGFPLYLHRHFSLHSTTAFQTGPRTSARMPLEMLMPVEQAPSDLAGQQICASRSGSGCRHLNCLLRRIPGKVPCIPAPRSRDRSTGLGPGGSQCSSSLLTPCPLHRQSCASRALVQWSVVCSTLASPFPFWANGY